jgi:hypothetical protein
MATLKADANPIVVDNDAGQINGVTTVGYQKDSDNVLWIQSPGKGWDAPNLLLLTQGGSPDFKTDGHFDVTLTPGDIFDIAIFERDQRPIDDQIVQTRALAFLKIFCLWKSPRVTTLLTDENSSSGGTWHTHQLHTNTSTSIVQIGASRVGPVLDGNGIPQLASPDGGLVTPFDFSNNHIVTVQPLLAGNHYFFVAVLADLHGNWQAITREFDTLRRQFTVQFPTIHIFNDGDSWGHGEGEFWFRVMSGTTPTQPSVIQDFHLPTMDIDDWSETDRPYSVGFAHVGLPETVHDGEQNVWVDSWSVEHDGIFESDEGAQARAALLVMPAGPIVEMVPNAGFLLDCPTSTDGDDYHYGVDIVWSVDYVP